MNKTELNKQNLERDFTLLVIGWCNVNNIAIPLSIDRKIMRELMADRLLTDTSDPQGAQPIGLLTEAGREALLRTVHSLKDWVHSFELPNSL